MKKLDKLINMNETQLVSFALKEHMNLSDIKKLETTVEVALERLPRTKHYRSRLQDAFLKLAEHYRSEEHYYEYVKALRKVLHVAPSNGGVINDQLQAFQMLLDNYGKKYIKKDFEYLEFVIQLFRLKYSKGRYSKKVHENGLFFVLGEYLLLPVFYGGLLCRSCLDPEEFREELSFVLLRPSADGLRRIDCKQSRHPITEISPLRHDLHRDSGRDDRLVDRLNPTSLKPRRACD